MASSLRLRPATMEDLPGVWSVCAPLFKEFAKSTQEQFVELGRHRWEQNPSRRDHHPLGWVLETEGTIEGFVGVVPQDWLVDGERVSAASGTSWAVVPSRRAHSISLYKALQAWGDDRFLLDTSAGADVARIHSALRTGMKPQPVSGISQRYIWFLSGRDAALRWLHKKNLPIAAAGFLSLPLSIVFARHKRPGFAKRPLPTASIERPSDAFDRLWERAKPAHGATVVRDAAFVQWRHFQFPPMLGTVSVVGCFDGTELLGYAAIRFHPPDKHGVIHAALADLFWDRTRPDVLESLLDAAFTAARDGGAGILETSGFSGEAVELLLSRNPYHLQVDHVRRWYKAPAPLREKLERCLWFTSEIDGDMNL